MSRLRFSRSNMMVAALWLSVQFSPAPAWPATDAELRSPHYTAIDADENRLLGSLFFYHRRHARLELGLRPLFSIARMQPGWHDADLLYPVLTVRTRPSGQHGQLLQFVRWSTPTDRPMENEWMIFPLVAYQSATSRSPVGFALFPLYGRLHRFLGQEQLRFALFPFWLSLERDQISRRFVLWPFFGWATAASETAPAAHGWRFWPFYGELTQEGVKAERFVLWPFFLHQRLDLNTETPQSRLLLFPLYQSSQSPEESSTWWLWPLSFGRVVNTRSHYEEWALPWPLIQFGTGDEKSISRVFPFYSASSRTRTVELLGKTETVHASARIVLWPLYRETSEIGPDWRRDRRRVLLFLYSDLRERRETPPADARRVDLWPLFTYNKTADGAVAFQTLALLEAFLNTEAIARNYSPLWSLATYRRDADGRTSLSFLWGLIQWRTTEQERAVRLFYLPRLRWQRPPTAPSLNPLPPADGPLE